MGTEKKCGVYVRVSTSKQDAENQLVQLRAFAEKNEWLIFKEYVDVISGQEKSRPGFDEMFTDAHKKLFDVLLFWDLSRFSRAGTLHTMQKLQELQRLGIGWHSYNEKYISSLGAFGDVVIALLATLAKIEREKISSRTIAALQRKKAAGQKLGRPVGKKDKKQRTRRYFKRPAKTEIF